MLSDLVLAKVAVEGFEWRRCTALVVVVVHGSCEKHTVGVERNWRSLRKERRKEGEENLSGEKKRGKIFGGEEKRRKGKGFGGWEEKRRERRERN